MWYSEPFSRLIQIHLNNGTCTDFTSGEIDSAQNASDNTFNTKVRHSTNQEIFLWTTQHKKNHKRKTPYVFVYFWITSFMVTFTLKIYTFREKKEEGKNALTCPLHTFMSVPVYFIIQCNFFILVTLIFKIKYNSHKK